MILECGKLTKLAVIVQLLFYILQKFYKFSFLFPKSLLSPCRIYKCTHTHTKTHTHTHTKTQTDIHTHTHKLTHLLGKYLFQEFLSFADNVTKGMLVLCPCPGEYLARRDLGSLDSTLKELSTLFLRNKLTRLWLSFLRQMCA